MADLSSKKSNVVSNAQAKTKALMDALADLEVAVEQVADMNAIDTYVDEDFVGENDHLDVASMTDWTGSVNQLLTAVSNNNTARRNLFRILR